TLWPRLPEGHGSSACVSGGAAISAVLRVRGPRRGALELEHEVVGVAVEPVLTRFVGPDDGVLGAAGVGRCVPAGRLVAAADVAAFLAKPEVDPVVAALRQAVLAPRGVRLGIGDLVEVGAVVGHGAGFTPGASAMPGPAAARRCLRRCWCGSCAAATPHRATACRR